MEKTTEEEETNTVVFDFYKELKQAIESDDPGNLENNTPYCLISHDPLDESSIQLECGHAFNYYPLFKELYNQKENYSYDTYKLDANELKCPYCRRIQCGLIPYFEPSSGFVRKIKGINAPPSACHESYIFTCKHVYKRGVQKGDLCGKKVVYIHPMKDPLCSSHREKPPHKEKTSKIT